MFIVAFTSVGSHTWTVPYGVSTVEVLVVAGGGGGGSRQGGGGGGAGGLVFDDNFSVTPGASISITVGAGGAGGTSTEAQSGQNGQNSVFGSLTAIGGGGGGAGFINIPPLAGGSGGGAGRSSTSIIGAVGTSGQGYEGGDNLGLNTGAGGGGGAGERGEDVLAGVRCGNGGDGLYIDRFSDYGQSGWFAGGGGGGSVGSSESIPSGAGGAGGGGAGGSSAGSTTGSRGTDGLSNTGGGGGGAHNFSSVSSRSGGSGGSGVVLVYYSLEDEIIAGGEGNLSAIAQQTLITGSGNLFEIEQAVNLRQIGSGVLTSIAQTVNSVAASGNLVRIAQRVRGEEVVTRPYEITVYIDGVQIPASQLVGDIIVRREENAAALATVVLKPVGVQQSLSIYHGKQVLIFVEYANGNTVPLYTGEVDIPEYDLIAQRITLRCTDRRSEKNMALPRSFIEGVGTYNRAIFGEPKDQADELEKRLSTVQQSLDYDASGIQWLTDWAAKSTPDFVLSDADVYRRDPRVEVASRGRLVNKVNLEFQYRYPRLRYQDEQYTWRHPIFNGVCAWYLAGSPPLVRKETAYAALGGTVPNAKMTTNEMPPDGFYRCCASQSALGQNCGYVAFSFQSCVNTTRAVTDASGEPVLDANGKPRTTVSQDCRSTRLQWAASASVTKQKRFVQTVTENIGMTFEAPASVQQYGEISIDLRYGLEALRDFLDWENDRAYMPISEAGNKDGESLADYQTAIRTAQAIARNRIIGSHRANFVSFQTTLRPEIDLRHTLQVDTRKIKSKGKVSSITHRYDCTNKWAETEVVTVHSKSVQQVLDSGITLPQRPNNNFSQDSLTITVRHERDRIAVTEPGVADDQRQEAVLDGEPSMRTVNIPDDQLEVFFDE